MTIGSISKSYANELATLRVNSTAVSTKSNLRKILTASLVGLAALDGRVQAQTSTTLRGHSAVPTPEKFPNITVPSETNVHRFLQTTLPPLTLDIVQKTQATLGSVAEETGFNGAYGALKLAQLLTAYDSSVDVADIISRPLTEVLANPKLKTLLTDLVGASAVAVLTDANIAKISQAGSNLTKGILTDADVRKAISGTVGDAATAVLTDANIAKVSKAGSDLTTGILTNQTVRTAISETVGAAAVAVLTDGNIAKISNATSSVTKNILTDSKVRTAISGIVEDSAAAVLSDANIDKISTATKKLLTDKDVQDALKSLVSSALDGLVAVKPTAACPPFGC